MATQTAPESMSSTISLGLALQVILTVCAAAMSVVGAVLLWYVKSEFLPEFRKNTEFRRYAGGTSYEDDNGMLGDVQGMSEQMEKQHNEVKKKVDYVIEFLRRINRGIDTDIDEPERDWARSGSEDRSGENTQGAAEGSDA